MPHVELVGFGIFWTESLKISVVPIPLHEHPFYVWTTNQHTYISIIFHLIPVVSVSVGVLFEETATWWNAAPAVVQFESEPTKDNSCNVNYLCFRRKMAESEAEVLKEKAKEAIDTYSSELFDLNRCIWQNPELGFNEIYAHDQLTEYLAARGFDVTPHYTLDTAFRAETGEDGGLTVGLICEYDALPEVGHACGHNLIAESGVAAALGRYYRV